MKVLIVVDGHLGRTKEGKIWSSGIYTYDFFARYLGSFDKVRIAIRIHDIESNKKYPNLCSGVDIEFFAIEEFKGPMEYFKKYFSIRRKMQEYFKGCDCGIFRIPSTVGYQFLHNFQKTKKPYAVEVVVDPWDFAAKGALKTPLRPIIRYVWTRDLKKACLKANGVSYVTKEALQKRYPSYIKSHGKSKNKFESYYSSVSIMKNYFGAPRTYKEFVEPCKIIHVTNFIGNHVKGHTELIEAVALLKEKGLIVNVDFIGEGTLIEEFEDYVKKCGVYGQIRFIGKLASSELVRNKLIESDMFVFPSHAEGLPRVLIEAMAVGLPCISTNVNGIPELLEKDYLIEVGDVATLAKKIYELCTNISRMNAASERNLKIAQNYSEEKLNIRRKEFYSKLSNCSRSQLRSKVEKE